jgi:hypothetical protein
MRAILIDLVNELEASGSWSGETHIQKCTFFLQEAFGVPLGLDFVMYKHGPFSFELRDLLAEMRAQELLRTEPHPPYRESIRAGKRAPDLTKLFGESVKKYRAKSKFVAKRIAPSGTGVTELERLGTALFVINESPEKGDSAELANRLVELKPHVQYAAAVSSIEKVQGWLREAPRAR